MAPSTAREHRQENRTFYLDVAAGLDAMRIHDSAARAIVRSFVDEVLTSDHYRAAFFLFLDHDGPLVLADLIASRTLLLWTRVIRLDNPGHAL